MCTVTYIPQARNSFILTSNRDEDVTRPAALPVGKYLVGGQTVYFPKDPKAGGTWIASGSGGFTVCLLNGAFEPHEPKNTYKKSRGLVLLDFFNYASQYDFIAQYDFSGIEPFTLIFVHHRRNDTGLCELRWDGQTVQHINRDASLPHIWSSVTLYSHTVIKQRETWFNEWIKQNNHITKESVLTFHRFGGTGDRENDLVMSRSQKKTVSICCITKTCPDETEVVYEDLIHKKTYSNKIITD
jgi:hypothetical protein